MELRKSFFDKTASLFFVGILSGFISYALYRSGTGIFRAVDLSAAILDRLCFWVGPGLIFGLVLTLYPGIWAPKAAGRAIGLISSILGYMAAVKAVWALDGAMWAFPVAGLAGGLILGLGAMFSGAIQKRADGVPKLGFFGALLGLGFYGLMAMEPPYAYLSFSLWQAGMLLAIRRVIRA